MKWTIRGFATRGTAAILAVVVLITAGCSGRRSQQYAEQGNTLLLIGNVDDALASFEQAVEHDPENADAQLGLARCHWLKKDGEAALAAYRKAIALNSKLDKAYFEAARICLSLQKVEEAQTIAQEYEAIAPESGGVLRAYILRETGKVAEAIEKLEQLRQSFPQSADVRVNLASAFLASGNAPQAEATLNEVLASVDPQSLPARMLLIEAYEAQGKVEEIVEELRRLASGRPNDASVQLALARALLSANELDEAESIVQPILEATPDSGWANFVYGCVQLGRGRFPEAVDALSIAFGALPNEPIVAQMLAAAQSGKAPGSPDRPPSTPTLAVAAGDESWQSLWKAARLRELLARRDEFSATNESNAQETLALAAVFAQDAELASELSAQIDAESPVKRFIDALLAKDAEALKGTVDAWTEPTPERQVLQESARGFAMSIVGARGQALSVYSNCLGKHPDYGISLYNIAVMYRNAGMPDFAVGALRKLIALHPSNLDARQMLSDVLNQSGQEDEARQIAEATYALYPNDRMALLMLARAYRDAGETALAADVLQRGLGRTPDDPVLSIALAEVLHYSGNAAESQRILDAVGSVPGFDMQIGMITAFNAAARSDWPRVLEICANHAGAAYPLAFRLLHTAALITSGKPDQMAEPLLSAEGTPISGPSTNIFLHLTGKLGATLSAEDAQLADAFKGDAETLSLCAYAFASREARFWPTAFVLLQQLDEKLPGQPRVLRTMMHCLALSPAFADQLDLATRYTAKYPQSAPVWLGLAEVRRTLNDSEGEAAALEKAVSVAPNDVDAWQQLARRLDEDDSRTELLRVYRRLSEILPDDPFMSNNLAYSILQTGGDTAEALRIAEKAAGALPRNPDVLHTLGLAQFRAGALDEAKKNLLLALEMRPGDPTLLLDVGMLLIESGQKEQGMDYVRNALFYTEQLGVRFPRRAEADRILAGE